MNCEVKQMKMKKKHWYWVSQRSGILKSFKSSMLHG